MDPYSHEKRLKRIGKKMNIRSSVADIIFCDSLPFHRILRYAVSVVSSLSEFIEGEFEHTEKVYLLCL